VLSVEVRGDLPVTYQWRKGGVALAGANEAQYVLGSARVEDSGQYDVVVRNPAGGAVSLRVAVSVKPGPVITKQPESVTIVSGGNVSFTVTASAGTRFQWYKDGIALANQTAATLALNGVGNTAIGQYTVRVTDGYSEVESVPAVLSIEGVVGGLWTGLVGYWPLDGDARDYSAFGNHGVMVGGVSAASNRLGAAGKSVSFDGTSGRIEIPEAAVLSTRVMTFNAWVRPTEVTRMVLGKKGAWSDAAGEQYNLLLDIGKPAFAVKRGSNGVAGTGWRQAAGSTVLPLNVFSMVTGVWDGQRVKVYVNGVLTASALAPAGDIDAVTGGGLVLGAGWASDTAFVRGGMDDVRMYNRVLSEEEIRALFQAESGRDIDGDGIADEEEIGRGRYEIVLGTFTWEQAKAHAEARGGHLATIVSEREWQSIQTVLGSRLTQQSLWIGGTDLKQNGRWEWVTGEKMGWMNWARNEPNDYFGAASENCLQLYANGTWNDLPGHYSGSVRGYLFERGNWSDPTMADTDGDGVNDKDDLDPNGFDRLAGTYEVVAGTFTWEQAKADAAAKGGYLATVGSAGEWEAMRGQLGEGFNARGLWFGGARTGISSGPITMEVKADVELDSVLEISPLGVRWQHVSGARPGTMNGSGYVPATRSGRTRMCAEADIPRMQRERLIILAAQ
jgi:hypothetical protein